MKLQRSYLTGEVDFRKLTPQIHGSGEEAVLVEIVFYQKNTKRIQNGNVSKCVDDAGINLHDLNPKESQCYHVLLKSLT